MHIYVLYNAVIDYCDLTFITRGGYGGAQISLRENKLRGTELADSFRLLNLEIRHWVHPES